MYVCMKNFFCQTMPGMTILVSSEKAGNEWCNRRNRGYLVSKFNVCYIFASAIK